MFFLSHAPATKLVGGCYLRVYTRRWREVILHAQRLTGKSVHQLEAEHLA